jgi:hypothetical protein
MLPLLSAFAPNELSGAAAAPRRSVKRRGGALLSVLSVSLLQTSTLGTPADVSALHVGSPAFVAELDLGKLKGELHQIGWSPDAALIFIQTTDGRPPSEKLRYFTLSPAGGTPAPVDPPPEWAAAYWEFKSDRFAPGIGSLMIDVQQTIENMKYGTGSAGAIDQADRATGGMTTSATNADRAAISDKLRVVRLKLLDETISEFVNEPAVPGRMFGWGPSGSGAIAFTDRDGRLFLFDQQKHKRGVSGAKDAMFPAWTQDGSRLAWVQKTGRRKYAVMVAAVALKT